jgi:hypothetical protein
MALADALEVADRLWQHHQELKAEVARVASESQREQIVILEERDEHEGIPPDSSSSC